MPSRILSPDLSQVLVVDMQERLLPAMADGEEALRNAAILMQAAAILSVPVTLSEQYPQGLGRTVAELQGLAPPGSVFEKLEFSCLSNPALRARLLGRTLILAGVEAHVCVLQTALAAVDSGQGVAVVVDAVASRRPASRDAALRRLEKAGVQLVTTEMAVFEWLGTKASPAFKEISRLVR